MTSKETRSTRQPLATLYQRSVLDVVVELAQVITLDSLRNPQLYRAVPEPIATLLADLTLRLGRDPQWPDTAQRELRFASLFGEAFHTTSLDLRAAAVAFVERSRDQLPDPLADRLRDTAVALRQTLLALEGPGVTLAERETGPIFQRAGELFRSAAVAGRFGSSPAPDGEWPLEELGTDTRADGAMLIEAIQQALGLAGPRPRVTQHLFLLLQRVAYYGGRTLAEVVAERKGADAAEWAAQVAREAYGWQQALQTVRAYLEERPSPLQPRVISRQALADEQLKGLITEEDSRRSGAQLARAAGGGGQHSCTYGHTWKCDTGPTCYTGFTLKCDTGPTCTFGFTLKCDSGPTCTYGITAICDDPPARAHLGGAGLQPRMVSRQALADALLKGLATEEDLRRAGAHLGQAPGAGGKQTCTYGLTWRCDTGPTCYTGFTLKCDTGPTCTSGVTWLCDTEPTCTYGLTMICDQLS